VTTSVITGIPLHSAFLPDDVSSMLRGRNEVGRIRVPQSRVSRDLSRIQQVRDPHDPTVLPYAETYNGVQYTG
jgi:hypothetical protein